MPRYEVAAKPSFVAAFGIHDPSAVVFVDGELVYGVEEERFSRRKHSVGDFPTNAIRSCLDYCDIRVRDLDRILLPYRPGLETKIAPYLLRRAVTTGSILERANRLNETIKRLATDMLAPIHRFESRLESEFGPGLPPIETRGHHACHAASAFHPSGFDEALVLTIDGRGEYDSTVVWRGDEDGLTRLRTYPFPNSLGYFFSAVTEFLGFRPFNGEGKVMGLAAYGAENPDVESRLRAGFRTGVEYDVTRLTGEGHTTRAVERLEDHLGRSRKEAPTGFTGPEKDLAFAAQTLLEETVTDIVEHYGTRTGLSDVALAGGVALNCKLNKRVRELDAVDRVFVQPVANDAGLAVGAGMVDRRPADVPDMSTVYWGPSYSVEGIRALLETNKIEYRTPDALERTVAARIADGDLVGWFQGRLEMGPRALGNRSILADPRTIDSRDRVNEFVKHREDWRPFAPSILESAAESYLEDPGPAPFMVKAFDVRPDRMDRIEGVVHPADGTTRPQTVTEEQNPRYVRLLEEFKAITGIPVLLNTSFNDHGEPIVNTPVEAVKDFYGMGLDVLVLEDLLVEK